MKHPHTNFMNTGKLFLFIFISSTIIFYLSCAHQIPPSGGPDDKTPPKVLWAAPPAGTVNVPKKSEIVFNFSKWVSPQNIDKCLSVFPLPSGGVKISVSGRKITVRPKAVFSDSTTYHIVFNTSLNDLHGNSIGTPYQHYFSTGPTIDSGRVFGCVALGDAKGVQPKVALYTRAGKGDTIYFGLPSYLTQTDSGGSFSFENIHRGAYEILAFTDANGNNRLDPTGEAAFAPVQKNIVLDRTAGPLVLYPVNCDTSTRHIATLSPLSRTCIAGEWAGGGTLPDSLYDAAWRIEAVESPRVVAIQNYFTVLHTRRFLLGLADTLGLAPFRLVYTKHAPMLFGTTTVLRDTIRFNGLTNADTVRPAVRGFDPRTNAELKPVIKLFWSKPVRSAAAQWPCLDTLKNRVDVNLSRGFGDTTTLTPVRALTPDMGYSIRIPDSVFTDIGGNSPHDSQGVVISFVTISEKDICFSISGSGASCPKGDSALLWQFLPLGKQNSYFSRDAAGKFRFDSLLAGKGRIRLFSDVNHDSVPTPGSLIPWTPPEQYWVFPDTVEARARWDVEGVSVTCETCKSKAMPAQKPAVEEKKK
ncbi:MAG TPA: Ig-like domain-containing protein [Chitinivibrionales bacterium]|nr:Ig-like domain-containing protein [Chitinivibrionales bacterium]